MCSWKCWESASGSVSLEKVSTFCNGSGHPGAMVQAAETDFDCTESEPSTGVGCSGCPSVKSESSVGSGAWLGCPCGRGDLNGARSEPGAGFLMTGGGAATDSGITMSETPRRRQEVALCRVKPRGDGVRVSAGDGVRAKRMLRKQRVVRAEAVVQTILFHRFTRRESHVSTC